MERIEDLLTRAEITDVDPRINSELFPPVDVHTESLSGVHGDAHRLFGSGGKWTGQSGLDIVTEKMSGSATRPPRIHDLVLHALSLANRRTRPWRAWAVGSPVIIGDSPVLVPSLIHDGKGGLRVELSSFFMQASSGTLIVMRHF